MPVGGRDGLCSDTGSGLWVTSPLWNQDEFDLVAIAVRGIIVVAIAGIFGGCGGDSVVGSGVGGGVVKACSGNVAMGTARGTARVTASAVRGIIVVAVAAIAVRGIIVVAGTGGDCDVGGGS